MIFLQPYKKYADFSGRARRKEYWSFFLFYMIMMFFLGFIDGFLSGFSGSYRVAMDNYGIGLMVGLFILGSIIPSIAVAVRRLHDTNRSGWWLLLGLIPLIGSIWLIVLFCFDSHPGENRFGKKPKEA